MAACQTSPLTPHLLLKLDAKCSALLDAYLGLREAREALLSGTLLLECTRRAHVVVRLKVLIEERLVAKLFDELHRRLLDELEAELLACVRQSRLQEEHKQSCSARCSARAPYAA